MRFSMSVALATLAIGVALAAPAGPASDPAAPGASTCDKGIDVCCGIFTPSNDPGVLTTLGAGSRVPEGFLGAICALPNKDTGVCGPVIPVIPPTPAIPKIPGAPALPVSPVATTKKTCTSFSSNLKLAAGCN
ncbi:MAG: hypothetical protein J3R72DRAFT_524102 [Linnemannia gamsii]|nr:MAG: hypothetical protein J3R72DRAFT_524102 [Linnemannia gamsii]